jgi:hypothetical protein
MKFWTPEQNAQLARQRPDTGSGSLPVVYLETHFQGRPSSGFMLTHIEPIDGKEAYGLMDF